MEYTYVYLFCLTLGSNDEKEEKEEEWIAARKLYASENGALRNEIELEREKFVEKRVYFLL